MLPVWCHLDILNFMNRDGLEKTQLTTQSMNSVIKRQFSSKPLRIIQDASPWVEVRNGTILIKLSRTNYHNRSRQCFVPGTQEWETLDSEHRCGGPDCDHYHRICTMYPALPEYVRFYICFDDRPPHAPYTADHISQLIPISHVWDGQILDSDAFYFSELRSFDLLHQSPIILRCRTLCVFMTKLTGNLSSFPNLYSLYAIESCDELNKRDTLDIITQKSAHPQSDTIFVVTLKEMLDNYIGTIRKDFLESRKPFRLRMIIQDTFISYVSDFRLENTQTQEALQLKRIFKQESKDNFGIDIYESAAVLERFSV